MRNCLSVHCREAVSSIPHVTRQAGGCTEAIRREARDRSSCVHGWRRVQGSRESTGHKGERRTDIPLQPSTMGREETGPGRSAWLGGISGADEHISLHPYHLSGEPSGTRSTGETPLLFSNSPRSGSRGGNWSFGSSHTHRITQG